MDALKKEGLVRAYFAMWVQRDFSLLRDIFSEDIYYSECYGPEYSGMAEIECWIGVMLQKQRVLEWSVKRFIHEGETVVAEWFFREEQDFGLNEFDGVSIIEFSPAGKIASLKEFESKSEHRRPYRGK